MVRRGTPLPEQLKHDAIVEALLELRFDTQTIPEVFYGRFVDHPHWKGFTQIRLPASDLPAQIRELDPSVRYVPILQLVGSDERTVLRIGPSVVSYHRRAPYVGWSDFQPALNRVVESLFETTLSSLTITRIGLRYLNALSPTLHGINSVGDLDLRLTIADDALTSKVNINFMNDISAERSCAVRIATKEFLQGLVPQDMTVFVDVDVFTPDGFSISDRADVNRWVREAHEQEKEEFFRLFPRPTIDRWRAG